MADFSDDPFKNANQTPTMDFNADPFKDATINQTSTNRKDYSAMEFNDDPFKDANHRYGDPFDIEGGYLYILGVSYYLSNELQW